MPKVIKIVSIIKKSNNVTIVDFSWPPKSLQMNVHIQAPVIPNQYPPPLHHSKKNENIICLHLVVENTPRNEVTVCILKFCFRLTKFKTETRPADWTPLFLFDSSPFAELYYVNPNL